MNNLFFLILDKTVKKSAPTTGELKKPHRWRPGTVALHEISHYQESIQLLIPNEKDFQRSVMKFAYGLKPDFGWQRGALTILQDFFYSANGRRHTNELWGIHAKRVANMSKDIQLARRIRGERT